MFSVSVILVVNFVVVGGCILIVFMVMAGICGAVSSVPGGGSSPPDPVG